MYAPDCNKENPELLILLSVSSNLQVTGHCSLVISILEYLLLLRECNANKAKPSPLIFSRFCFNDKKFGNADS
jgi:hypothetical protein